MHHVLPWTVVLTAGAVATTALMAEAPEVDRVAPALLVAIAAIASLIASVRAVRRERHALVEQRDVARRLAESLEARKAELFDQNAELRALLAERARGQERIETLYRVGQRLAGELDPDVIVRVGLAGLCALAGSAGGAVALRDGRRVTFGDCPDELLEAADCVPGISMGAAPWGAWVRLPVISGRAVLGAAHITLPDVADIPNLDGPAVSHLAGQIAVALDHAEAFHAAHRQTGIIRAVLDATPDAIHLVDNDGAVVLSNAPFRQLLVPVLGPSGGVDARCREDVPNVADPDAFLRDIAQLREADPQEAIHQFTVDDSGRSFVRFAAPVLDREGQRLGRLFVHRDVTAEREADRVKDEFLALVSHELRTPLTSVIGYLELVLDGEAGELSPPQSRFLEVSERNARRLLRLVGDLLVVAQAEAGRLGLTADEHDLSALIAERVEAAGPSADAAGVTVRATITEPVAITADRERIGQVLDNLIGNAIRHAGDDGEVVVSLDRDGNETRLVVADSGPGIPDDELPHVFQRFYRGARAVSSPGTGLGLSICQLIADAHDGRMEVSTGSGGAAFTLVLPTPAAVPAAAPAP